jgi:hypothetical protein
MEVSPAVVNRPREVIAGPRAAGSLINALDEAEQRHGPRS